MFLYPANQSSQGAKRLAQALDCRRIRHNNSRFTGRGCPWVVNWGASAIPLPWKERVRLLNAPEAVQRVTNKKRFFQDMMGTGLVPSWTDSFHCARDWLIDGKKVVCRTILNGHCGVGIVIAASIDELIDAPLYVQYIPKKSEYRVHIFNGQVIDVQRKVSKRGIEPLDWRVRVYSNGFIYQREMVHDRFVYKARDVALECMNITDLDFGAVDVIYNERQDRSYVLEINTAPGLEGQTVIKYAEAIRNVIQGI